MADSSSRKRLVVLGSTGSIGTQALDVVRRLPDRLRVIGLSAHRNATLLHRQASEFGVPETALECGDNADLVRLARMDDADLVVVSVAGAIGTRATLAALDTGKDVALASKEVLVAAGNLVMATALKNGRRILPVDSEHSAIFQCLQGSAPDSVEHLWLTASGGPFRSWTWEKVQQATRDDALQHPTWPAMGRKITIDSATLMNKGLELIEARWLFGVPMEQISVVVHPQSVIHSMVQFRDSSVLAQLGLPDMRLPIQYALLYPERSDSALPRLDLMQLKALTFEPADERRFPCLRLARHAASQGGTMPAVLNAANEAAVALFLEDHISFASIPMLIERVMAAHTPGSAETLTEISDADAWARRCVKEQTHGGS